MDVQTILQWNCRRIIEKKSKVCDLNEKLKLEILCIQETMLSQNATFRTNNFTMIGGNSSLKCGLLFVDH